MGKVRSCFKTNDTLTLLSAIPNFIWEHPKPDKIGQYVLSIDISVVCICNLHSFIHQHWCILLSLETKPSETEPRYTSIQFSKKKLRNGHKNDLKNTRTTHECFHCCWNTLSSVLYAPVYSWNKPISRRNYVCNVCSLQHTTHTHPTPKYAQSFINKRKLDWGWYCFYTDTYIQTC